MLNVIQQINESPYKLFCAITGGGTSFLSEYLSVSGASKTILGACIPYSEYVLTDFIKRKPEKAVSSLTARQMAVEAFNRGVKANDNNKNYVIGLGVSCSLAKDDERPNRTHKIYISLHSQSKTFCHEVILMQGRGRFEEENLVKCLIFRDLSKYILGKDIFLSGCFTLRNGESENYQETPAFELLYEFRNQGRQSEACAIFFCGSWNPIHAGHKEMIEITKYLFSVDPILELSIENADKGQLDYVEIDNRLQQIKQYPHIVTNAPTFKEKVAKLRTIFENGMLIFVVGADTWARIWDAKYAGPLDKLYEYFLQERVRFIVFKRGDKEIPRVMIPNAGYSYEADDLRFKYKETENFNMDISSTNLRKL